MAPKVITCEICDRPFSKRFSLNRHMSSMHQVTPSVSRRSILCPVEKCGSQFPYQGPLRTHLKDAHDILLDDREINFATMEAFFDWKRDEEETFSLKYVKACGTQRLMDGIEVYRFNCFRTGMYNPEGKGLRRLKAQGSVKIGASCPSTITAHKKPDGQVTCSYCMTHVGHDLTTSKTRRAYPINQVKLEGDLSAMDKPDIPNNITIRANPSKMTTAMVKNYQLFSDFDVSTEDRLIICNAVSQNKSPDEIFDRVRKSIFGDTDREYGLLLNELRKLNRNSVVNDMMTDFQLLTEQCNASQEIPVVFYEGLISETDGEATDTFILVIMNSYQVDLLKAFGNQGMLCVDPIYSMEDTGYIAIALYVWSPQSTWLLCSICFCQNFNYATMKAFFGQIFIRTGAVRVKNFITEDAEAIHSAWVSIMGNGSDLILSPWHIDHKLRCKLKSLTFTDSSKMACMYRVVRSLIETTSEDNFNTHLNLLLKQSLNNSHVSSFNKFLTDGYVWKKYNWAKYCRSENERLALSLAEAGHLLARRICHGEDLNLGQTLFTVFQYYRGRCLCSWATLDFASEEGPVACPDLSNLGDVYATRPEGQKVWTLQIGETSVDIIPTGNSCSKLCSSCCVDCQVCVHRFRCSCVESVIQWKFCKHIHLFGHHLLNSGEEIEDEELDDVQEDDKHAEQDLMLTDAEYAKESSLSDQEMLNNEGSEIVIDVNENEENDDINSLALQVEALSQEIVDCAKGLQKVEHLKSLGKQLKSVLLFAQTLEAEDDKPTDEVLLKLATLEDHNYTM